MHGRHYRMAPLALVFALFAGCSDSTTAPATSRMAPRGAALTLLIVNSEAEAESEVRPMEAEANTLSSDLDAYDAAPPAPEPTPPPPSDPTDPTDPTGPGPLGGSPAAGRPVGAGAPGTITTTTSGCTRGYIECTMVCMDIRYSFNAARRDFWYADDDFWQYVIRGAFYLTGEPMDRMRNALYTMRATSQSYQQNNCSRYSKQ